VHARARGAHIVGELIVFGATADAGYMVQPDPVGTGAGRAMALAERAKGVKSVVDQLVVKGA